MIKLIVDSLFLGWVMSGGSVIYIVNGDIGFILLKFIGGNVFVMLIVGVVSGIMVIVYGDVGLLVFGDNGGIGIISIDGKIVVILIIG